MLLPNEGGEAKQEKKSGGEDGGDRRIKQHTHFTFTPHTLHTAVYY